MADRDTWFKFYPHKWLGDLELMSCTDDQQGIMARFMCRVHQSNEPGYLLINGAIPTQKEIQKILFLSSKKQQNDFKMLVKKGVIKHDKRGVLYNEGLLRQIALRKQKQEIGKLGGNPKLDNQELNQQVNQLDNPKILIDKEDTNRDTKRKKKEQKEKVEKLPLPLKNLITKAREEIEDWPGDFERDIKLFTSLLEDFTPATIIQTIKYISDLDQPPKNFRSKLRSCCIKHVEFHPEDAKPLAFVIDGKQYPLSEIEKMRLRGEIRFDVEKKCYVKVEPVQQPQDNGNKPRQKVEVPERFKVKPKPDDIPEESPAELEMKRQKLLEDFKS